MKLLRSVRKNWTRAWLIFIAFACCAFAAIAAYTEVSSVKRVVSTADSPGKPFSSNCMRSETATRRLTTTNVFPISVCNFDQDYPKNASTEQIKYDLIATLIIKYKDEKQMPMSEFCSKYTDGTLAESPTSDEYNRLIAKAANYYICKASDDADGEIADENKVYQHFNDSNSYTYTFSGEGMNGEELRANRPSTDIYNVTIDPADLNPQSDDVQFFVEVMADPKNDALPTLSARLYGTKAKTETALWRGTITEENCASVDYDFYNYVITGSGVGTIDILWNEREVYVNKFFLIENGVDDEIHTVTENDAYSGRYYENYPGWKYVTLSVNSIEKNRYEIQLYKVAQDSRLLLPGSCIACEFNDPNS